MANSDKSDRRAIVDQMRKQQKGAERRRGAAIVGVCVFVALVIVGLAAYGPIKRSLDLRDYESLALSEVGSPASVCQDVTTKPASGTQDHVVDGTQLFYEDAPPAFGQHYYNPDPMERKLYTKNDRPPLGNLVHNLEHGYTLLWYDETIANDNDAMNEISAIADKLAGTSNLRTKFKAVPWLKDDGKSFPEGQHIALTHWSVGGVDAGGDASKQVGVWQYCTAVSGAALDKFMLDYPYMDTPEPGAM